MVIMKANPVALGFFTVLFLVGFIFTVLGIYSYCYYTVHYELLLPLEGLYISVVSLATCAIMLNLDK